ncbi:MAG: HD domain-containing protein [Candidatus Gastranaerophilales bacterium]|nr:HD domain-containing protein [Candidatus Gastranaerophilales bacterium]
MNSIKPYNFGVESIHQRYAQPDNSDRTLYIMNSKPDYFAHSNPVKKSVVGTAVDNLLCRYSPELYINKYLNEDSIKKAVQQNPNIKSILESKGLEPEIHMENITGKNKEHFLTTYDKAKELGGNLTGGEYDVLLQSALLHDIGKALIPPEILNKPGRLTKEEREIVNLHAYAGAEILKGEGLPPKVVEAVRLHHTPYRNQEALGNKTSQILSVADVYSALKEFRPYKSSYSDDKAYEIMRNDEKLNPKIVEQAFPEIKLPLESA